MKVTTNSGVVYHVNFTIIEGKTLKKAFRGVSLNKIIESGIADVYSTEANFKQRWLTHGQAIEAKELYLHLCRMTTSVPIGMVCDISIGEDNFVAQGISQISDKVTKVKQKVPNYKFIDGQLVKKGTRTVTVSQKDVFNKNTARNIAFTRALENSEVIPQNDLVFIIEYFLTRFPQSGIKRLSE